MHGDVSAVHHRLTKTQSWRVSAAPLKHLPAPWAAANWHSQIRCAEYLAAPVDNSFAGDVKFASFVVLIVDGRKVELVVAPPGRIPGSDITNSKVIDPLRAA